MVPYKIWVESEGLLHTDPLAVPVRMRREVGIRAARVVGATHRGATLTGVFELADDIRGGAVRDDGERLAAHFAWYDTRPISHAHRFLRVDPNTTEILENYTGDVVCNVARP